MEEPEPEERAIHWKLSGRVQGVGLRWYIQRAAVKHDVVGDVCNGTDGRVEIRAVGEPRKLKFFLDEVRRGPQGCHVDRIEELEPDPAWRFQAFEIRIE